MLFNVKNNKKKKTIINVIKAVVAIMYISFDISVFRWHIKKTSKGILPYLCKSKTTTNKCSHQQSSPTILMKHLVRKLVCHDNKENTPIQCICSTPETEAIP